MAARTARTVVASACSAERMTTCVCLSPIAGALPVPGGSQQNCASYCLVHSPVPGWQCVHIWRSLDISLSAACTLVPCIYYIGRVAVTALYAMCACRLNAPVDCQGRWHFISAWSPLPGRLQPVLGVVFSELQLLYYALRSVAWLATARSQVVR